MGMEQITLESIKQELQELREEVNDLKSLKEDLEFSKSVDEVWQEIDDGKGIEIEFDDFMKEIKKW